MNKIKGLIAAPFTPMDKSGNIRSNVIVSYADKLKRDGLKGAFICGTTGEGMLLTNDERKVIAEKWVEEQEDNFKILVHVGTTSGRQSKDLAVHAQAVGAYAIGCMGPVFLKPNRTRDLVSFCAEVAAGAPELPFYYYHIPHVSGVNLSMIEFLKKAPLAIPNFAGIKFTDNNFMEMQECIGFGNKKYDILHGFDELLLAGLAFGVEGAVGSTYNFMAPLYYEIMEDFGLGNISRAREKQLLSVKIIKVLNNYGGATVSGKRLMQTVGVDCGDFRSPVSCFNEAKYDEFIRDMEEVGFFELTT